MTGVTLTRRRVLGGLLTVGLGGSVAGAVTEAAFDATRTSDGNTVRAATLDLTVDDRDAFDLTAAVPPDGQVGSEIELRNHTTVTASLDVSATVTDETVAEELDVESMTYGGDDLLPDWEGSTLADLPTTPVTDLADPGEGTVFRIDLRATDAAPEGESTGVTFVFDLIQES